MEVISKNDAFLTNVEVMDLLREQKANHKAQSSELKSQRQYLHSTIGKYVQKTTGTRTREDVQSCVSKITDLSYGLTKFEILQICNLAPTTMVEIHAVNSCYDHLISSYILIADPIDRMVIFMEGGGRVSGAFV